MSPYMLDDPAAMKPLQRRREIAAILARGVLRLHERAARALGSSPSRAPEESAEILSYSLEVGATPRPHAPENSGGRTRQKGA
jgi:hypothetical protein